MTGLIVRLGRLEDVVEGAEVEDVEGVVTIGSEKRTQPGVGDLPAWVTGSDSPRTCVGSPEECVGEDDGRSEL